MNEYKYLGEKVTCRLSINQRVKEWERIAGNSMNKVWMQYVSNHLSLDVVMGHEIS